MKEDIFMLYNVQNRKPCILDIEENNFQSTALNDGTISKTDQAIPSLQNTCPKITI